MFDNLKIGQRFFHRNKAYQKISTWFAIETATGKRVRFSVNRPIYPTRSRFSKVKV